MHLRSLSTIVGLCIAAPAFAQDLALLQARCLLALHGHNRPPARRFVLTPPAPEPGGLVVLGPHQPGPAPKHTCPLCTQELVQTELWRGKPGIDSQDIFTAHVCEQHQLFFVTNDGPMHSAQAGPFALPIDAKTKPVRPFLPWGAVVADDAERWPGPKWASADGSLEIRYPGDDVPLEVHNTDRMLFREPKADNNGMAVVTSEVNGDAGLVAFARSMGPLLVGALGTGKRLARVGLRADNVVSIGIHPNGSHVAFVVLEGGHQQHSLRLLDVASGKVHELAREPNVGPMFFAFDQGLPSVVTATWDGTVSSWSLVTFRREWERKVDAGKAAFRVLAMAPGGKRVFVGSRGGLLANLLDTRTGTVDSELVVHSPLGDPRGGGPITVAWSADGTKVAWSFGHGRLCRADVAVPGEVHRHFGAAELLAPGAAVTRLRFLPDGKSVQTRDANGHHLRWPLATFVAPW